MLRKTFYRQDIQNELDSFFPLCGKKEKSPVNLVKPVKEFKYFFYITN